MTNTTPETRPRTTRPALDILDRDQDRILYAGDEMREPPINALVEGFHSRQELIEWYQAAAVRTLGHVSRLLPPTDLFGTSVLTDALIIEGGDNPAKQYVRQRLTEKINDTCDIAYQELRVRAVERVDSDDEGPDYTRIETERQKNPAQRPAFRVLDETQAAVLVDLWDGFQDRLTLSRWVKQLRAATNGEQPRSLMDTLVGSPILLDAMLRQTPLSGQQQGVLEYAQETGVECGDDVARRLRERFAIKVLLPAFVRGARTLRGSERAETVGDDNPWNEVRDMEATDE